MFRVDSEFVIDATFKGNEARYLNHSCDVLFNGFYYQPNCQSLILETDNGKTIVIYAKKNINIGEEITYDY